MKYVTPRRFLLLVGLVLVGLVLLVNRITGDRHINEIPVTTDASTSAVTGGGVPADTQSAPAGTADVDEHDDGTADGSPLLIQPTTIPDAKEAATAFTAAWLNTSSRNAATWRAGLKDRVTPTLWEALAIADPATVPAGCRTGEVTLTTQGSVVDASAPIVTNEPQPKPVGTLTLMLLRSGDTWLVSEIDWEAQR